MKIKIGEIRGTRLYLDEKAERPKHLLLTTIDKKPVYVSAYQHSFAWAERMERVSA